ncbi:hypothetical protein [Neorhizobium sp. AL 9.2.2]
MKRLGEPAAIGNTIAIAGPPADRVSFEQVCSPGYQSFHRPDGEILRSAA